MRRTKEEAMKTRDSVLSAAAQIIVQHGGGAFTIDAVAQEAGVTKGGVLHHFPSKEALIDALIDQVIEAFKSHLMAELAAEPEGEPGRWLRAYIRTIFSAQYERMNLLPALVTLVASNPQTLDRIRRDMAESQQAAVGDDLDPTMATIIRLAVDGVVFTSAFNVNVLDTATSQNVYDELLRLTRISSI